MEEEEGKKLYYVYSCDVKTKVRLKIGSLEGILEKPSLEDMTADPSLQRCVVVRADEAAQTSSSSSPTAAEQQSFDLFVSCTLFCDGKATGSSVSSSYKSFFSRRSWNEWLTLPVGYDEVSRDAVVALTVWDLHDGLEPHAVASSALSLFSRRAVFRKGRYDLQLWPFVLGDGSGSSPETNTTWGKRRSPWTTDTEPTRALSKLSKKHRSGLLERLDWLDRLTFRQIETLHEHDKRRSKHAYLLVEFPLIHCRGEEHLMLYYERNGDELIYSKPYPSIVLSQDPECGLEELIEAKHHLLARRGGGLRGAASANSNKPSSAVRSRLEQILLMPPGHHLTSEQKDLIWKFRYFLCSDKRALSKFLQSVQWADDGGESQEEADEALRLLHQWPPMDLHDVLELLGPRFVGRPAVRAYAVQRLTEANNRDLLMFLPQLVQAVKYEGCSGAESYVDAAATPLTAAKSCHWTVEGERAGDSSSSCVSADDSAGEGDARLSTLLIERACADLNFASYLFWYLKVECDIVSTAGGIDGRFYSSNLPSSPTATQCYSSNVISVMKRLDRALQNAAAIGEGSARIRQQLVCQQVFVNSLVETMRAVVKEGGGRRRKIEFLQSQLSSSSKSGGVDFGRLNGLPLPLDPSVRLTSVVAERASLFSSALMPCKLTFRTEAQADYVTIFKQGDDLRQDQLVIQMIRIMDKLLRSENLDLRLTPYNVLATSPSDGFVQFVESQPLRDVIQDWNSIQEYFRFYRPSAKGPFGIETEVMENYVRSCAGYSVICYLLGVGDRHQHNLLLCKNGRLFHVDFGYILGRDPKPMPPPMKLTREMLDGMGGAGGEHWRRFRDLCFTAFLQLRRHANLVLNLFALMLDAGIADIALESDKALTKVEERFHLALSDEQAVQRVSDLIEGSLSALVPVIMDMAHDVAQRFRN